MTLTLYGVTSDGTSVPIEVTEDGKLVVDTSSVVWTRDGTTIKPANDGDSLDFDGPTLFGSHNRMITNGRNQDEAPLFLQNTNNNGYSFVSQNASSVTTAFIETNGSITAAGGNFLIYESGATRSEGYSVLRGEDSYFDVDRDIAPATSQTLFRGAAQGSEKFRVDATGAAMFASDVVIGSRGSQWLIRESNGVAMLVEQTRRAPRDFKKVRDLPNELDLVEAALNEVMSRLKMVPPAGWPVWDGQSEVTTDNDIA